MARRPEPDAVVGWLNASNPPRLSTFATRLVIDCLTGESYELKVVGGVWVLDVWTPPQ